MMSVIRAQSTDRKLPSPTPMRIAPPMKTGIDGAKAHDRHPHAGDETGHVDHPLAPEAVGDLRGRDRRDRRAQRHDGRRREDADPRALPGP